MKYIRVIIGPPLFVFFGHFGFTLMAFLVLPLTGFVAAFCGLSSLKNFVLISLSMWVLLILIAIAAGLKSGSPFMTLVLAAILTTISLFGYLTGQFMRPASNGEEQNAL